MKKSRLNVYKKRRRSYVNVFIYMLLFFGGAWYLAHHFGVVDALIDLKSRLGDIKAGGTAQRGYIYDRHFAELAINVDKISVFSRNREVLDPEKTAEVLAGILSKDAQALRSKLGSNALRTWLAEGINKEQEEKIKQAKLPGVHFEYQPVRYYPQKGVSAHLTGYVQDDVGLSGVEYYFDRLLGGALKEEVNFTSLKGAQDLVLTIDLNVQSILSKFLKDIAEDSSVNRLACYVIETNMGNLVAGAQYPVYDPNHYRDYSHNVLANMFLQTMPIPPKIRGVFEDAALLYSKGGEEEKLLPWSIISLKENLADDLLLWDWLGFGSGWRPDFATSEKELGVEQYFRIDMVDERKFSSVPEEATPLQVLMGLASIAGSGEYIRAHVVEKIVDRSGFLKSVSVTQPSPDTNLSKSSTVALPEVQKLMTAHGEKNSRGVVFLEAEQPLLLREGDQNSVLQSQMFFASLPASYNGLALLLVVEKNSNVVKENEKNIVASLGEILQRISSLQQVSQSISEIAKPQPIGSGAYVERHIEGDGDAPIKNISAGRQRPMPDLSGVTLRKSLQMLQGYNCTLKVEGTGWVGSQYPPPGSVMEDIETCRITLQKPQSLQREKREKALSKAKK